MDYAIILVIAEQSPWPQRSTHFRTKIFMLSF